MTAFGTAGTPGLTAGTPDAAGNIIVADVQGDANWTTSGSAGLTAPVTTLVGFTDVRGLGHTDTSVDGDVTLTEVTGDLRAGMIRSRGGDILLTSRFGSIEDAPTGADAAATTGDADADVVGVNVTLLAPFGTIGSTTNFLELDSSNSDGTLRNGVVTATALASVYLTEIDGIASSVDDLRVHTVTSQTGDVTLTTRAGSIIDARNDTDANVLGDTIDLDANGGHIGDPTGTNDLEIDSGRTTTTADVGLEADGSIHVTETSGPLVLVLAHSLGTIAAGDIRLAVSEHNAADAPALNDDLSLLERGAVLVVEAAPRTIGHGQIFAEVGNVLLWVGDDIDTHANSEILANLAIDIFADATAAALASTDLDPTYGATVVLRGRIIADCMVTPGTPAGTCAPSTANPVTGRLTTIYGHTDVDTIQFGDPTGDPYTTGGGGTTQGNNGYLFLGSKTRAYGTDVADTTSNNDEDSLTVYYLQSMNVGSGQLNTAPGAGHTLTLDGRQDSDTYEIWTTGSALAFQRNYVINILDTGLANDGVDEASIHGTDATADLFLLRTSRCIDTESSYGLHADGSCASATETANRPGFVALLHGTADAYTTRTVTTDQPTAVQRINYDTALNGRLSVEGGLGDDSFYTDDTSVIITLDGGGGNDTFQVGQVFGTHRTTFGAAGANNLAAPFGTAVGGNVAPADTFPQLIPTTRGWLSPGTGAPLVAVGGTGNDRFTVYANQSELRLEGGEDNDIFTVRAFAIAATCNVDATGDGQCTVADVASPLGTNGQFLVDSTGPGGTADGFCGPGDANFVTGSGLRRDVNGDGVCTAADAKDVTTPALVTLDWLALVIPLDALGVAVPVIGAGFSTARPLDIRTGGGDDEVSYNVNAPVSIDGGTGFDKVVVLGTEFADDFVVTSAGIFGGGLNVRFAAVEIVEIDGLEGDDEFFVLSTAFGVAYRIIGGLGSDTINVAGDVVEDIIVRELEGVSGSVNHQVTSGDGSYAGLPVEGIDVNVATGTQGNVVVTETGGGTAIREGGSRDSFAIRLAVAPMAPVYVTASAARSPQQEADGSPAGDTMWVCTGSAATCAAQFDFLRARTVAGATDRVANRAVVLTFDASNWSVDQYVWLFAVDDTRAEGDRVVTVNHSVISADAAYHGTDVRNVEVTVRDNDTPGVQVIAIDPLTGNEDARTIVVEGTGAAALTDQMLVQLATAPTAGTVRVQVVLDAVADAAISVTASCPVGNSTCWNAATRTISFTAANWDIPVLLMITARQDARTNDPRTVVVRFEQVASDALLGADPYEFPRLYAPPVRMPVVVWDDETADVVVLESDGSTQLVMNGAGDNEWLRLTRVPTANVDVAVVTDGLVDVVAVDGTPVTPSDYAAVGGYVPSRLFLGALQVSGTTLTRGAASNLGSFVEEGFAPGQFIRITVGVTSYDVYIATVTDTQITLTNSLGVTLAAPTATISALIRSGWWQGTVSSAQGPAPSPQYPSGIQAYQLVRPVTGAQQGWLAQGFVEGQWVRVTSAANAANSVNLKIDLIRGLNDTQDSTLQFTVNDPFTDALVALPAWLTANTAVTVVRIAAVVGFTPTDWARLQEVEFAADPYYVGAPGRGNVKVYPATKHLLSRLQGPLAVEGGVVAGADRILKAGAKLPGETDGPLFNIAPQAPESTQIDVLNIFNDSSRANTAGALSQTTLTGFGMSEGLNFLELDPSLEPGDLLFGESAVVPGGISFGAITLGTGGSFATNGGKSTIEVLNLLLGEGNDHLSITGTLDPQKPASVTQTLTITLITDITGGLAVPVKGIQVTRPAGSWLSDGYLVGDTVSISGLAGSWLIVDLTATTLVLRPGAGATVPTSASSSSRTVTEASDVQYNGMAAVGSGAVSGQITLTRTGATWASTGFTPGQLVLVYGPTGVLWGSFRVLGLAELAMTLAPLAGAVVPAGVLSTSLAVTVQVPGRHGGLTVVHGGGNTALVTAPDLAVTAPSSVTSYTTAVRRLDGLNWAGDGFVVGQRITVAGVLYDVVSIVDGTCALADPFAGCGTGSVLRLKAVVAAVLGAGAYTAAPVAVVDPLKITVRPTVQIRTNALVRTDGGSWLAEGFRGGLQVRIEGLAGLWTVAAVSASTLTLAGAALSPTISSPAGPTYYSVVRSVTSEDPLRAGQTRMGGDTIVLAPLAGGVLGGPGSPLVVYGDTSQDGVWYSGNPGDTLGYEFGPKPFDPFYYLRDQDNEDDEWVFPLANPFQHAGNDVIDGRALFATFSPCNATTCDLPTIGFTAYGGAGNDVIYGSQAGDHLAGGSGDDTIIGQRGVDHVYGDSGFNVNILDRALTVANTNASPRPTLNPTIPGDGKFAMTPAPSLVADTLDAGLDTLFGNGPGTVEVGPPTVFQDIVFGDYGSVLQNVIDPNLPDPRLQKIQTTQAGSILRVCAVNPQRGGDDTLLGSGSDDVLIGGAGHDMIDGLGGDDLIFGDNACLQRTDYTSERFQTLAGTVLYSRTDIPATGATADTSGALLTDGTPRYYRDPDGAPWWAEYDYDFLGLHSFAVEDGLAGVGTFGNDYLAGGPGHDMIFGQLGNDVIQGDGSIAAALAGLGQVGASRTPDGCVATSTGTSDPTHAGTCDLVGDLDVVASFDGAGDGQDYIEGGGGNDIVFGNLGQDDIIGGSSDLFGLTTPELRPDGADLLFGGSGLNTARNDNGGTAPGAALPINRHSADADTMVGDNGRIIRIVGVNHADVCAADGAAGCQNGETRYVSFVYDNTYGEQLVVRGVHLLDYTPGGPDFRPDRFNQSTGGTCHTGGSQTVSDCSVVFSISNPGGRNRVDSTGWSEIFGNDEIHGELGDDTIYLGGGADVAYGDAADDDIIGGWGNDWISGGVGQDGILGDDGRIFTSRNNASVGEPLFGVAPFLPFGTCSANHTVLCGNYLNQWIASPGDVQTAIINVEGDLKKTVDLTPYNLTPNASGGDQPLFDANNSDDVIFGGLGGQVQYYPAPNQIGGLARNDVNPGGTVRGVAGDFLHGGAGDDAIAGGEAIWNGYTQVWTAANGSLKPNAHRSDWTRPFNAGDLLHFGQDYDAWHNQGPIVTRLGEFALYDEYDPRRTILLNANGTANKSGLLITDSPLSGGLMWFLNLYSDEGPALNGCVSYAPNGTCLAYADRVSDGSDAIFGDLGNDWMVGGTGQDTIWGGWGNDLANADDVMTIAGTGSFGDQKGRKIQPSPNDTPDTHPLYQDRVYGGAGLDVLIGNTGGDRLIDWVGEFNSYIVPFAPFGIATVSRQVPPWLYEFLYALSASQGADPTRYSDTGKAAARNGEPDGELGLIIQQDHGLWQDQTGGPSDPQPGNIPGGRRDVLRSADFNDASFQAFFADTGAFDATAGTLSVAASSQGGDAAAVYNIDQYLPIYFEVAAKVYMNKPTAGWKANAFVIFDYFGPNDFKFAGLNQSTNKIVMGRRTAAGWLVDVQASVTGGVKYDTWYTMLLAVNGTTVTVLVNSKTAFTHTFAARTFQGELVALNKGFIGVGSDNARGQFDDIAVQVLPPVVTLDATETFTGTPGFYNGVAAGSWAVAGGKLNGTPTAGSSALVWANPGAQLQSNAFLELTGKVSLDAGGFGGIAFDGYSASDYKFAALDLAGQRIVIGHVARGTLVIDASVARALVAGTTYTVLVTIKGASVSVTVNGAFAKSMAFNSALADGSFGFLARTGTLHVDEARIRTDGYTPPPTSATTTPVSTTSSTTSLSTTTSGASAPTTVSSETTLSATTTLATPISTTTTTSLDTTSTTATTSLSTASDPVTSTGTTGTDPALALRPVPGRKK